MASSSIAAQLAKSASLNASLFLDRSRRKPAESYLFTSREADQHDFHSLHALGVNGLSKLKSLNSKFARYENSIFSDAARGLDRTLQSESQNAELDRILNSFLKDLGPYLLEAPSSKALEWLVRRFRINEFNVDALMVLFLPYHETAHFTKMVSILHIKDSNLWTFMSPLKAAAKPLPRSMLVNEMVKNIDIARFIVSILPDTLENANTYRVLVGFTASVVMDYLMRLKKVNEEVMAFILPSLTQLFADNSTHDCTLAGYIALASLAQHCRLSPPVLLAVLVEMLKGQKHTKAQSIVPFLIAVLGPQDQLDIFPETVAESILSLPDIVESFADCLRWVGAEKLVLPLIPRLISGIQPSYSIVNAIILSENAPDSVTRTISRLFLERLLQSKDEAASQFLAMIFQRHSAIFSEVSSDILQMTKTESDREALEEVIRSAGNPSSKVGGHGREILSSSSVDAGSRAMAVRDLVKALEQVDNGDAALEYIREALRMRIADTNVAVIEALYNNPKAVLPTFNYSSFVDTVASALTSPETSRAVMHLHFSFIAGSFYPHNQELAPTIFEHIFLPYLLFSKPRQKTAALVWQVLSNMEFGSYELFNGCSEIMEANSVVEGGTRSVDDMTAVNLALTSRIASNIMASQSFSSHLEMLLRQLTNSDAYILNISYLILRSLLVSLTGEHQVNAAKQILFSMGLQSLDTLQDALTNMTSLQEIISDDVLVKGIVAKPSSAGTLHRLQVGILALFPVVQQPVNVKINWLEEGTLNFTDTRAQRFAELAHAVYSLANSSSGAASLSTSLIKALFINLREDALLFLAGVWTKSLLADPGSIHLPCAALFHGAAFLQAQIMDADQPQDFQVVLPSLLVALRARQRSVRSAAMDCIGIIARSTTSAAPSSVYALDSVYGNSTREGLQYLEWSDFGRFVTALNSRREHCIHDGDYIQVFVQESFCELRTDGKKVAGYKQRVLCYLLSHIITWSSTRAQVVLLEMLKHVPNRIKLQMLLPLVQVVSTGDQAQRIFSVEDSVDATYIQLLIGAYDATSAPDLNETGSVSWITFVRLLRLAFGSEITPLRVRNTFFDKLNGGLFDSLTEELKLEVSITLIECAARSEDSQRLIKANIGGILKNDAHIVSLLAHFRPVGKDTTQRVSKRAKIVVNPEQETNESPLRLLTTLIEILIAQPLSGSIELLSTALDTLTQVCHVHSLQPEANYVMQLFMTMLDIITTSIAPSTTLAPSSIRMEILVELLRVSDNPQTFSQTLFLIANLARLAPEFVMQNVMPIFTFMGSNVFHRDDSYSFRVVQKTVDSIVPVVITSLKHKHPGSLDLQKASRDFICVFTDAATHVPRHRRTHFFNHLVEVLGPEEFVVPICLLLVDKIAHKLIRQKSGEVVNTLSLPLTIVQANFKAMPFKAVGQLLHETTRLLSRVANPDAESFLSLSQEGDVVVTTKKQIQAIVIFVDLILQQSPRKGIVSDDEAIKDSVRILLALANLDSGTSGPLQYTEVSKVSIKALGHLLRVISAREFVLTISTILSSKTPTVENGALNLLASRLVNVSEKMRQEVSPIILTIIDYLCGQLKESLNIQYLRSILNALRVIAQTADSQEIPALAKVLPLILHAVRDQNEVVSEAIASILPLSAKIGPRILPMFRDVVQFCRDVLLSTQVTKHGPFSCTHQSQVDVDRVASTVDHFRVEKDAQAVLLGLLSSISQFWTVDELVKLGELSLDARPSFLGMRKTMAKRVPAKQLLPALCRLWSESNAMHSSTWSSREAFFDILKRTLRNAPRDDIQSNLRDIFIVFLEALDLFGGAVAETTENFESIALSAFVDLVTKLNEAAFKPLFRRLFDWAFNNTTGGSVSRQITFNHVLTALIKLLKGLITPYMGVVLTPITDLLATYRTDFKQSGQLWLSVVELLQTSLVLDEGAFWREDKLSKLGASLVDQIDICPSLEVAEDARAILKQCFSALVAITDDDSSLKKLNLQILMKTRSDAAQVRLFALQCAAHLWDTQGDKLVGFVTDIVTFIAESAEDEHDEVAKAARALKRTAEKRCGNLDMLMQ